MIETKLFESISNKDIEKFEKQLGYSLPEDYRQFLLKYNGGDPYLISYRSHLNEEKETEIVCFFGIDNKFDPSYMGIDNYSRNANNLLFMWSNYQALCGMPNHILYIADSSITAILMSVGPEDYGYIYSGSTEDGIYDDFSEKRARKTSIIEEMKNLGFSLFAKSFTQLLAGAYQEDDET